MFDIFHFENKSIPDVTVEEEIVESLPLRVAALLEEEEVESIEEPESQNFSGWYALDKYKGMSEVSRISLWKDYADNEETGEKPVSYAGVFTSFEDYGDQGFVESIWAEVNGNNVRFRTNKIKGIEYRFKGVFFKNKMPKIEEKTLSGTLQKFVKGKKVAEVSGDFAYHEPVCWH